MPLNLESLDDEVVRDGSPLFDGGMVSNARASALNANQLSLLQNVDISVTGKLTTRRGTVAISSTNFLRPIQGISYFDTPALPGRVVIVVSDGTNGVMKIWNGSAWIDPSSPFAFDPLLPVQMVQGISQLWITQKNFHLSHYDGTNLGTVAFGTNTTAPVEPAFVEWHTDRLVCSGMPAVPDNVSFSQFLDGFTWDHANWDIRIGAGDGDPVTGITSWSNFNLVVFKEHSVWVVNCNPALADPTTGNISGFTVNPVHKRIGCLAGRSAVQVGSDVFFLSDSGIRSVSQTIASESQQTVGPALSEPINDIIARINPAALSSVSAFYWQNRYFCALPLDAATFPQYTIVYNTLTKSWSGYWSGITPMCFTRRVHSGTAKLCMGLFDGSVVDFLDYILEADVNEATYQDQGHDIATIIQTKAYTCGELDAPKTGFFNRMEFTRSQASVNVYALIDDLPDPIPLDAFSTSGDGLILPLTVPFDLFSNRSIARSIDIQSLGQWRELKIQINSIADKLSLSKIAIGAFQDSFQLQA